MPKLAGKDEERVPFVAKPGVTIYHQGGGFKAGTRVMLPKSHADKLAHLRADAKSPAAKPVDAAPAAKASAEAVPVAKP